MFKKILNKILNIVGLVVGVLFIATVASDIQIGFGCVLILISLNNLF